MTSNNKKEDIARPPQEFDFKKGAVLLLDKPLKLTSFAIVHRVRGIVRRAIGEKKIKVGHAGTLDPLATGLLIVCTGRATKTIAHIQDAEKEYVGTVRLGMTTPSYDLETEADRLLPTGHITNEMIANVARSMLGEKDQMPPIFSAKQVNGQRAYLLARAGKPVSLQPKRITIKEFEVTGIVRGPAFIELGFRTVCSKGTYIRSLAYDMGCSLNSGGCLSSLRRVRIGGYKVDDAITADQLQFLLHGD